MTRPLAGPQSLLRSLNARAILEALARRGALTRAELMRETGLSRTAVTQVLRMLDGGGFVAPAGEDRTPKGPAAARVSLHPQLGFAAAVHLDHRTAHAVIVDPAGNVRAQDSAPLPAGSERAEVIARLVDGCRRSAPLHAVVVAAPGIVTGDGQVRDDLGPDGGALRHTLAELLGCPVRIENDVNLAALAELSGPVGAVTGSFALLALLDDGMGAGFIIDGVLHRGASGLAGEVQYVPQTPLPIGAPVLSPEVIADLALAHDGDPALGLRAQIAAAEHGDPAAHKVVAEVARRIVLTCGSIALILDPEVFVLAGAATHPLLAAAVHDAAAEFADRLPLQFAAASFGTEAPLVGAIAQAASALRSTLFSHALSPENRRR
ncbi:ROK family transcriptional regulator [Microbacterium sp.]|uniref:ROK family transcriptional regulator n=1 Tax=Microbacterium sp. TaxID=51671 RepID=UPI0028119AE0|nr:ROK family transcriptional regulator [Microbacterium sp.]